MQALNRELEVARALARRAGEVLLRYHRAELDVDLKEGDEPVTAADRESSDVLLEGLRAAFPHDLVISEEEPPDLVRLARGGRAWFVDPLDGTREFIAGLESFSVMIGLAIDARPVLGVVYQPTRDRIYEAAPGAAPVRIDRGEATALACSPVASSDGCRFVASYSDRRPIVDEIKRALGTADELNLGSVGLKIGLIAAAERDLYVNPTDGSKAWDTCAPAAILEAAGGRLTDLDGEDLRYLGPDLRHRRGLVASNGRLHEVALKRLAPLF